MSAPERLPVGVCTILIETRPDYLVLTITTNRNLDRNLYSARPEPRTHFTDPEAALDAVAQFIRLFDELRGRAPGASYR